MNAHRLRSGEPDQPASSPSELALRAAMTSFMLIYGFGALHLTVAKLEGDIAREHRARLAAEGWIA